jgi:Kef-type K+ transport system membrane component KefB
VLFVLTGATLAPSQFGTIAWLGAALVLVRLLGKTAALYLFARPAKVSARQTATLSLALTPMAGLAIGMTQPIYDVAPEFGAHLSAIIASSVAILSVLGPIATRYALIASGEGEPEKRD